MWAVFFSVLMLLSKECSAQDEDDEPYQGKLIGKLNSYHHQVSGDVYAVDEWTILLVNFNYDGTGDDTFFWAGDSGRPGPQGFIIPDEHGKTNVLERYYDATVRLRLPEGKRLSRVAWFAVWDLSSQAAFGDVLLPDDFVPPAPRRLAPLLARAGGPAVRSGPVTLLDSSTILIPELYYDGSGEEVYFWMGVGPQPSAAGYKIPDELGYLEPLRAYNGTDVRLGVGGGRSLQHAAWLALWDVPRAVPLASVLLPAQHNVPPHRAEPRVYRNSLPHCVQLHRDVQVGWEVFGNAITIQLAAKIEEHEYIAFGISGSQEHSTMLGADVAVGWYDPVSQRALVTDYNITALAPCVQVLGQWRGVCRDDVLGGQDSNQPLSGSRADGLTVLTYRRDLKPVEPMDREWSTSGPVRVVWAVGARDADGEPSYHRLYPRRDVTLDLAASPPRYDCLPFTSEAPGAAGAVWETAVLADPALRLFRATLGPGGGRRGAGGRARAGGVAPARVWYINGQLAPDLQLRRGLTYTFLVSGGSDPHSADLYHPLMISAERRGGLERLPEALQRAARVLAGVQQTRRRPAPTAAGPACVAEHAPGADPRRDETFPTFRALNRTLRATCQPGAPAALTVTPDTSWPDLVYYTSFTHADMGGRIFVVDRHKRALGRRSHAAGPPPRAPGLLLSACAAALLCAR